MLRMTATVLGTPVDIAVIGRIEVGRVVDSEGLHVAGERIETGGVVRGGMGGPGEGSRIREEVRLGHWGHQMKGATPLQIVFQTLTAVGAQIPFP